MVKLFVAVSVTVIIGIACGSSGAPVGAACDSGTQCASGHCGGPDCFGHCTCGKDSDCPAGQHCQMTIDCGGACM